jgi:cellulose synthase operon protein YhjQ
MDRADDIANLFRSFGANTDSYLEIDSHFDYKEPPPKVRSVARVIKPELVQDKPQPVEAPTAVLLSFASSEAPQPQPAPLRHLLAEVAQARQAEAQARNDEALVQSLQSLDKGQPPKLKARVVAVVSAKGGVGKTTLSAALATLMQVPGGQTLALDLDPQNALQHHLSVSPDVAGMGNASLRGESWSTLVLPGSAGTHVLPFGVMSEDERRSLEGYLRNDSGWLARQLSRMALGEHDVVVIDTPPGPSAYLDQVLAVADQVLVVTSADAASYLTLDYMERLLDAGLTPQRQVCSYVINQFDASRAFSRDMQEVLKRRLGERLLGVVHLDHDLNEALAYGRNPVEGPCISQGARDLQALSLILTAQLMRLDAKESQAS